jgi:transcriptional regulator with PAS, ATPase and Fis domain
MQLDTQSKLLRVLQNHDIQRVGDSKTQHIDVRVIAATNRDLKQAVDEGQFRKDLYYRLNVISLQLPPLRERGQDVVELANHFGALLCERMNKPFKGCGPKLLEFIQRYDWPGNIRELQNVMERLVILSEGPVLDEKHLPKEIVQGSSGTNGSGGAEELTLAEMERRYILEILERYDGQKSVVADKLGISTTTLWRKLKEYGVN